MIQALTLFTTFKDARRFKELELMIKMVQIVKKKQDMHSSKDYDDGAYARGCRDFIVK